MLATATTIGTPRIEWATRLLAAEGAFQGDTEPATAAARVYDKLANQLAPLVGAAGVQAIFARSAKLAQGHGASSDDVAPLFATFLGLMPTFIGERLTRVALMRAWPHLGVQ